MNQMYCYDVVMHLRAAPDAGPTLDVGTTEISWTPMRGNPTYEVVCGDMLQLRGTGGDFSASTDLCLANEFAGTALPYVLTVDPGQGIWFLVREETGAFDSPGESQAGYRDVEIHASLGACP